MRHVSCHAASIISLPLATSSGMTHSKASLILPRIANLTLAVSGLSPGDAVKAASYLLFRPAQDAKTLAAVRKAGVANNFDFLDGLSDAKGPLATPQFP